MRRRQAKSEEEEEEGVLSYVSDPVWNGETLHNVSITYIEIIMLVCMMNLSLGIENTNLKTWILAGMIKTTPPGWMLW